MTLKSVWDALKASAGVVITAAAFAIGLAVLVVAQVVVFAARLAVDLPG
ncbi:hypothetical protein RD149_10920 [Gordonia westfalica]|uniref:Uncharacterized protein n=2 Tax=Gordonia TaxID=2053 RepID=A0AAW6RGF6_GORRU|nr:MULTISPECIES: hypothetical protein [Gordonia]ASR05076.1 hypothetical protein GCWB2_21520 [Gordonia rubripertincta]MDG6783520.1 hypothetical protein [Gordonia rubripertincta]MDJ0010200.1 hypothetical protein [Gordonia alkanivorans]MDJ0099868.1 hypothetical protein [Gordonia alkanivorans]MDJ0495869.1 hypothetical protein [Gordonia alkanivorans]